MDSKYYFTSESVTEGHPDKICDQISDGILDELLRQDPMSRCACEVTAEPGAVHIMGEITTTAKVDYIACARNVIRNIGYTKEEYGFTNDCEITCSLHEQSPDIAMGVDQSLEAKSSQTEDIGAGDQGMMFGYACNETDEMMPLAITLAGALTKRLAYVRKQGILPYLRPDGKSQVTVEYENGVPVRVDTIVISAQHDEDISLQTLQYEIVREVIHAEIPLNMIDENTKIYVNPTGRFVLGGPVADTGLTGRKIIADTYGGYARHGGGAFSGKDPTKVDRSAAYMARYIAKNIIAAGLADKCEVQLSYAIGVAEPISIFVDTFGTGYLTDKELLDVIYGSFDLRPASIIDFLQLRFPIYEKTAAYGHFGRNDITLKWENTDLAETLKNNARVYVMKAHAV